MACNNCNKLELELKNTKHELSMVRIELENIKNAIYSEKMIEIEQKDQNRIVRLILHGEKLSEHDEKMAKFYGIKKIESIDVPRITESEIYKNYETVLKERNDLETKLKNTKHELSITKIDLSNARTAIEEYRTELKK